MELNEQEARINPDNGVVSLAVDTDSDIVSPEPVHTSIATADRPATQLYRDAGLWISHRRFDTFSDSVHLEPLRLRREPWEGRCFGPAEVLTRGEQGLGIQGTSTRLWNRSSAPRNSDSDSDA